MAYFSPVGLISSMDRVLSPVILNVRDRVDRGLFQPPYIAGSNSLHHFIRRSNIMYNIYSTSSENTKNKKKTPRVDSLATKTSIAEPRSEDVLLDLHNSSHPTHSQIEFPPLHNEPTRIPQAMRMSTKIVNLTS